MSAEAVTAANDESVRAPRFPFRAAVAPEPEPEYALLRATEPVARVTLPFGGQGWLITRYNDVKTVLADPRFSRAATSGPNVARFEPVPPPPVGVFVSDPPEQARLRSLIAQAFTMRRVEAMRARVRTVADDLATGLAEAGESADLVTGFALPFSVTVISDLLGIPLADRERFQSWCDAMLSTTALSDVEIHAARRELSGFLGGLVTARRERQTDDLLGGLVQARDNNDSLSEEELVIFTGGLLTAGYETTASQLANFVYLLLRDGDAWPRLAKAPELVPAAVEELLRYVPSLAIGGFTRVALEDVTLSGVTVRAGDTVIPVLGSANHDEAVFDGPDVLNLDRSPNPHLAFGHGAHRCVGAQLARVELQEALYSLLARWPRLRLASAADEVPWKRGFIIRGVARLPVTWSGPAGLPA
jgi:cytochrome P450